MATPRPIHEMEAKWQAQWQKDQLYRAEAANRREDNFYALVEFPFPSGDGLHVGHVRSYVALDVLTRKQRMLGKHVLYPMGWDAFGLPTENYAIKTKTKPRIVSAQNVANFKRQLQSLGLGFDWSREVDTTDPAYYKWTQWQFLQFVKYGLAYKAASTINWCPKCKIGLANEEAQGGVCERCGTPVEKREKYQWMIKITKYAERLLKDLDLVDYWEKIKTQQRNWIGKSEGAEITFALQVEGQADGKHTLTVFTTRPDTIYGVTFLLISPETAKRWLDVGWQGSEAVRSYVNAALSRPETERSAEGKQKTGVDTGVKAIHPFTNEAIPVWVADYVLGNYGTGAVMAVPAHDERDFAFAKTFDLPMKQVVASHFIDNTGNEPRPDKKVVPRTTVQGIVKHWQDDSVIQIQWKNFPWKTFVIGGVEDGETLEEAIIREVREETGYKNIRLIKKIGGEMRTEWYAPHKDENRYAYMHVFLIELADGERVELSDEEKAKHDVAWVPFSTIPTSFAPVGELPHIWKHLSQGDQPFGEEGKIINSGEFSELRSEEARKKVMEALESKKIGQKTTTYKLRDWVFSRQRYWGEPIPMVFCKACAKTKQKVLLVHGYEGGAEKNWFPWMKQQLENAGFEVFAPTLPDPASPTVEAWSAALQPFLAQLGPRDIIVAHSLGGKAVGHALLAANKQVGHLFCIGTSFGNVADRDWTELEKKWPGINTQALKAFWSVPLDWSVAGQLVEDKRLLVSSDDHLLAPETLSVVPNGWYRQVVNDRGHFQGRQYPELVEAVLTMKETGWVPLPETQLPLTLPEVEAYEPSDSGESPLAAMRSWVETTCPRCGGTAERETDTMPNWAGSSWYFLRYTDPKNDKEFASAEALKQWMPVDLYNGGMEHTTLHLLYSRFWHKFLWDIGSIPREISSEPYKARRSHGMINAAGGEKMSKSKGNVVNPDEVTEKYGADVLRVYELFMGPFDQPVPWDVNGIEGVRKFLDRVWQLGANPQGAAATTELETLYHQTLKKISEGIDQLQFNTCVSQLMILTNAFQDHGGVPGEMQAGYLQMIAPFAPHLAEELWSTKETTSIHHSTWPIYDATKLQAATYELVVQVSGKVRAKLTVASEIEKEEAVKIALQDPGVQKWTNGAEPKQVVFVKGRLLNLVM